eukprot:403373779
MGKDEAGNIVCYQCQGITKPSKYKEDPEIIQILGQDVYLPIYCDNHSTQTCEILCLQCDILTCSVCAKNDHEGHIQKDEKIAPEIYQEYIKNAISLLLTKKFSIDSLLYKFKEARDSVQDILCSKFMKMYKDVRKLFSTLDSNKQELQKLDLSRYQISKKNQPQERGKKVEIITSQYVNERIPKKIQTQDYTNFLELVNIEIEKDYRSLLLTAGIENFNQKSFKLLYQGSRDGFTSNAFHQKCDKKGPTVCFVLSEFGQVFGGCSSISWNKGLLQKQNENAFIFQLCKKTIHRYVKNEKYFDYPFHNHLLEFGKDIQIIDGCDSKGSSCSTLGNSFQMPNGYKFDQQDTNDYLAGEQYFIVSEIEVYSLE